MRDLGTLGGKSSWAQGINAAGDVVGASYTRGDQVVHAFVYHHGKMLDLCRESKEHSEARSINNSGQICGQIGLGKRDRGFLYKKGKLRLLPTPRNAWCRVLGMNGHGDVIGTIYRDDGSQLFAFVYASGHMHRIGLLPGTSEETPLSINDVGQVVGVSSVTTRTHLPLSSRAFLYFKGKVSDLGSLLSPAGLVNEIDPQAINSHGVIVGCAKTNLGDSVAIAVVRRAIARRYGGFVQ